MGETTGLWAPVRVPVRSDILCPAAIRGRESGPLRCSKNPIEVSMRRGGARVLATVALLLVIMLPATGCIVLAVGGAGTAAYEVAKDDRTIGTKLEDGSITSSVKTRLLTDERINALDA